MRALAFVVAAIAFGSSTAQTQTQTCKLVGCTEDQLVKAYQAALNADPDVSCGDGTPNAYVGEHTEDTTEYKCFTSACSSEQIATQFLKHLDCNSGCGSDSAADCPSIADQRYDGESAHTCKCENGLYKGVDCVDRGATLTKCTECLDDFSLMSEKCTSLTLGFKQAPFHVPLTYTEHNNILLTNPETYTCGNSRYNSEALHYSSLDECWQAILDANANEEKIAVAYHETKYIDILESSNTETIEVIKKISLRKGDDIDTQVYSSGATIYNKRTYGCRVDFKEIYNAIKTDGSATVNFYKANAADADKRAAHIALYGVVDGWKSTSSSQNRGFYFCKVPDDTAE